jgi:alpha-ketoglutarate-dependent 2,4-dichlorophenoxyacetate dioxygenase
MEEYAVLVFRDQPFADNEQLEFAQRLHGVLHTKLGISALQKNCFVNEALGDISNLFAMLFRVTPQEERQPAA